MRATTWRRNRRCTGSCGRRVRLGKRSRQATHPPRAIPELVAVAPNKVWSYDATALAGPARGVHYDLLVMLDIHSRYSPGWLVVDCRDGDIVKA